MRTLLVHLGALAIATGFSCLGAYALYKLTDAIIPMRVTIEQEDLGLDLSQHGETILSATGLEGPAAR